MVKIVLPLPYSAKTTDDATSIMKSLLNYNPSKRPKLEYLLKDHQWFKKDLKEDIRKHP